MKELDQAWGKPTAFNGLDMYPVQMKNADEFYEIVPCLLFEKNKIPVISILKMSYLKFLFELAAEVESEDGQSLIHQLQKLLELITKKKVSFGFGLSKEIYIWFDELFKINETEFDEIRLIILKQNLIPIDEETLDIELSKVLKEAREFVANRSKSATLAEQVITYQCLSGNKYEDIAELTIYQFSKGLERYQLIKNYEVFALFMTEHGNGDKVQHYLVHVEEKGLYDDILMSKEQFDNQTSDSSVFEKT